jgi:tetratricopeptide (TPR) repeat protein
LGIILFQQADFNNAIKEFELADEDDYLYSDSIINIGKALCELKEYKRGLKLFLKIYEDNTEDLELMFDITNTYYSLGEFENSLTW